MEDTSQRIIDAAMELIMEKGYSATTTKDIAGKAGVNECTIFRKFGEKKEIVLQAMEQNRWHPDLKPEDFNSINGDLKADLEMFARRYMEKVTPDFVKLSIGLRTPELTECTAGGIMKIPQIFKEGLLNYFRKMHQQGTLIRNDFEELSMMFLAMNFGFVFLKASFGDQLTVLTKEQYIHSMIAGFVDGIRK